MLSDIPNSYSEDEFKDFNKGSTILLPKHRSNNAPDNARVAGLYFFARFIMFSRSSFLIFLINVISVLHESCTVVLGISLMLRIASRMRRKGIFFFVILLACLTKRILYNPRKILFLGSLAPI